MTNLPKITAVLLSYLLLVIPVAAYAAGTDGMSEEQMQEMMQNARKMQECFEDIDRSAFDKLEQEGKRAQAEIEALCEAGKRDEAQAKAMAYGRKISESEEMQEIQKCGAMMEGMMDNMPAMMQESFDEEKHGHICDER